MNYSSCVLFLFICYIFSTEYKCLCTKVSRLNSFKPHTFLDSEISILSNDQSDINHLVESLNNIAVERVPGTPQHAKVKDYIIQELKNLDLHVETDKFSSKTPFGVIEFENIIATVDPKADKYIVLAAHYDSKYFKDIPFIGATDSAVPCAMLLNLVKTLKPFLDEKRSQNTDGGGVSLKLVFFDGEEAFVDWSDSDSIYGARHLARKWQKEDALNKIEVLVLLDLIGTPDPSFHSYFRDTDRPFERLISAENRLAEMEHLSRYSRESKQQRYFKTRARFGGGIQDDHIPFLQRGVPILHLITSPFPDCWHTVDDNLDVVDYNTVENLQKIFRVFIAEYLKLNIH